MIVKLRVIFAKVRLKLSPGKRNHISIAWEKLPSMSSLCVQLQSWYYYLPSQWPVSARIPGSRSGTQFHTEHLLCSQLSTQCGKPLATAANSSIWILDHNQKFHKPITTEQSTTAGGSINFKVYYELFPTILPFTASLWPMLLLRVCCVVEEKSHTKL